MERAVPHRRVAAPVSCGFTLVEVLVATTVLAVVGVATATTLSLALTLVRAAAEIFESLDTLSVESVCGMALLLTRRWRPKPADEFRSRCRTGRAVLGTGGGFTLVEVLVALGVMAMALGVAAAVTTMASESRSTAEGRIENDLVRHGLGLVLQSELGRAGAMLPPDVCSLAVGGDGGRLDVWWRQAGEEHHVTYAAGVDAAGRVALYRRRHPHARQPWLEDVRAFRVVDLEADEHHPSRLTAITVELAADAAGPRLWRIDLPHRPCLRELPP